MVRKTQIKQNKSKSQLRKTLKHYSKTNNNKKGGVRWRGKSKNTPKNNQTMTAPPVNTFENGTGVKRNPLFKNNNPSVTIYQPTGKNYTNA
jgi:hypothetical protein